ncbi:hypothetical protein AAFF_G00425010 [Aldrovandia affinis]|uniref:Uncharacterized protein n=1 Tax=Aldrovandia affinis TaxID=143900 RepID=A0AAD7T8G0_9TELE|nr:hypothetical protein AAFF_G00425010 [Aldrovandia affinis]
MLGAFNATKWCFDASGALTGVGSRAAFVASSLPEGKRAASSLPHLIVFSPGPGTVERACGKARQRWEPERCACRSLAATSASACALRADWSEPSPFDSALRCPGLPALQSDRARERSSKR